MFDLLVVDDFLEDPDRLWGWAMTQVYQCPEQFYGLRLHSREKFDVASYRLREKLEDAIHAKVSGFDQIACHGRVWLGLEHPDGLRPAPHVDGASGYAALLYLTPGLRGDCGTSFWRHRPSGRERFPDGDSFSDVQGPLNPALFEETDRVAYRYNRLVSYPVDRLHSATRHSGSGLQDGRLHTMFLLECARPMAS